MLLVEAPREAAVPPCAALDPMTTLTKLNFTDYSAKVSQDDRVNYEQALASVARLGYEQAAGSGKLHYEQSRLAYDPVDAMCADPAYILPASAGWFQR